MPAEKLYLHTDKPSYFLGDTIWYKSYLLNADLEASAQSKLLYIELCTDSGVVVSRQLLPVYGGISFGNISLDSARLAEGSYTIRGYTNWMRNFGENSFFTRQLQLYKPEEQNWLAGIENEWHNQKMLAHIHLKKINGEVLAFRDVAVKLISDTKTVFQGKAKTDANGKLDIDFAVPEKSNQLTVQIKNQLPGEPGPTLNIPVVLQKQQHVDLQFLPESGHLVSGITTRVAIKAMGEDGKFADVDGNIFNSKNQLVCNFKTTHAGMGSFTFTPEQNEKYTAAIKLPDGVEEQYPLPDIATAGTVLSINPVAVNDSFIIHIQAQNVLDKSSFYLFGQSRNSICYAGKVSFSKNNEQVLHVPATAFPTGVARFTLLNGNMQPLNERMIFVNHHDNLNIEIVPHKAVYNIHDSIALTIQVKDKQGQPVQGTFSLAVTDDGQVKADSTDNIATYFLLTSNLKGTIENPNYYFSHLNINAQADLDNLLLTQGWTGFDWKDVFNTKPAIASFAAESEYNISGRVTNVFNKGVANTSVTLLSKRPFLVMDTLTDNNGNFIFRNVDPADTAFFFIQAKNKKGNSANVGIEVNEFKPPVPAVGRNRVMPWYVNTSFDKLNFINAALVKKQEQLWGRDGVHQLMDVVVTARKAIKGSLNLNGPGQADQVIGKEEMDKAGKATLGEILKQQVKEFNIGDFPTQGYGNGILKSLSANDIRRKQCYLIGNKQMRLVIDGYDVDYTFQESNPQSKFERFLYIKSYLDYYTAEDIKGIEVMYSKKYNTIYNRKILSFEEQKDVLNVYSDIAYLEITTHSGKGPFMKTVPGIYLYKPLPFSLPKKFYSPRYTANQETTLKDFRTTIHWEPNVVTDVAGKAIVSFYSSDKATGYTVILQGCDMNGNVGFGTGKIQVTQVTAPFKNEANSNL